MKVMIVKHPLYSQDQEMRGYLGWKNDIYVSTYKNPFFIYTLLHELLHLLFDYLHLPKYYDYWLDVVTAYTRAINKNTRRCIIQTSKRWYFDED